MAVALSFLFSLDLDGVDPVWQPILGSEEVLSSSAFEKQNLLDVLRLHSGQWEKTVGSFPTGPHSLLWEQDRSCPHSSPLRSTAQGEDKEFKRVTVLTEFDYYGLVRWKNAYWCATLKNKTKILQSKLSLTSDLLKKMTRSMIPIPTCFLNPTVPLMNIFPVTANSIC